MTKVASFFTGGGFMDLGFEQEGFEVAWTNEIDEVIADMYEAGMTSWRRSKDPSAPAARVSFRGSINDVDPEQVRAALGDGPCGIIGGPPCPAFSIAGKQGGKHDFRGQLAKSFVDKILAIRPTFFLFENVPGLLRTEKHRRFLHELRTQLEAQYRTALRVLNALEFGAPQDRERMFMVGFLRDSPPDDDMRDDWFAWPKPKHPGAKAKYAWPDKWGFMNRPQPTTLADMMEDGPKGVPLELTVMPSLMGAESMPNGKEFFVAYSRKFATVEEGDVHRKSCKRLHRGRYSPTAAYGNNEVHFHPWLQRRLSVREALRIQTVPDEYVLPAEKPLSAKFKMAGNGVPCVLARAMAAAIKATL